MEEEEKEGEEGEVKEEEEDLGYIWKILSLMHLHVHISSQPKTSRYHGEYYMVITRLYIKRKIVLRF